MEQHTSTSSIINRYHGFFGMNSAINERPCPLSPVPSWTLYENPFFTEGQLVPKYSTVCSNPTPFRPVGTVPLNGPAGSQHELSQAPDFCRSPVSNANSQHITIASVPSIVSVRDRVSVISARKLAASFWEKYGGNMVDIAEQPCGKQAHFRHSSSRPLHFPMLPSDYKIPSEVKVTVLGAGTASEDNMASSQAATLANVLLHLRSVEENQSRSTAVLNKLRVEMGDVTSRIQEVEFSHKAALREINSLLQRFGEQLAISRRKEQEKVKLAFLHLREEMEEERNACRLLRVQNKKLAKDLTHANMAAADACEELDRERKARELLEEVCNELAREIGEDKAEVEQLKQEQEKSRERLEEELKMMRMAALWRDERVRSKLSEAQLELDGKQCKSLHELRSKVESFISSLGISCEGPQEEIDKAGQTNLLGQALDLLHLDESKEDGDIAEHANASTADFASSPTCSSACFVEKASKEHIYADRGKLEQSSMPDIINRPEHNLLAKEVRKTRRIRRRPHTSWHQRQNVDIRPQERGFEQNGLEFRESMAWHTSDDEFLRKQSITLHVPQGHTLQRDASDSNHVYVNSVVERDNNVLLATDHGRHSVHEIIPSVSATSSESIIKSDSCCLVQNLCNSVAKGTPRNHSSSARYDVEGGGDDMGRSLQYSFSEDDAASYIKSRAGMRTKEEVLDSLAFVTRQEVQDMSHDAAHRKGVMIRDYCCVQHQHEHNNLDISESVGRSKAACKEDSELDDFYFEPLREPAHYKLSHIANAEEKDANVVAKKDACDSRDQDCCNIMTNCSQASKDLFNSALDENTETSSASTLLTSQDPNIRMGTPLISLSPWRSGSAKPLQCFWPPSPDAFSIFGGVKKRSKGTSSTPRSADHDQQIKSGLCSRRSVSPALSLREAPKQQHAASAACMKSNSLGAQLIKARELDNEKPTKAGFRFSPLRRTSSHG